MRNIYELVAKAKYNLPDEWHIYRWEALGIPGQRSDVLVTGAVAPLKTRGKRKGQRNWSKLDKSTKMQGAITNAEIEAFLSAYEASSGNCHECEGSKEQWAGWSATEGNRYVPCRRCGATGLAPEKRAA